MFAVQTSVKFNFLKHRHGNDYSQPVSSPQDLRTLTTSVSYANNKVEIFFLINFGGEIIVG